MRTYWQRRYPALQLFQCFTALPSLLKTVQVPDAGAGDEVGAGPVELGFDAGVDPPDQGEVGDDVAGPVAAVVGRVVVGVGVAVDGGAGPDLLGVVVGVVGGHGGGVGVLGDRWDGDGEGVVVGGDLGAVREGVGHGRAREAGERGAGLVAQPGVVGAR